jgi:hypothetical protein
MRIARDEEERRHEAQERRRNQDQRQAQRINAIEREWGSFKAGVSQVQRANMARAFMQHFDGVLNEVSNYFNPPAPPPEPEVIYVEAAEGSDQLGTPDFNPKLWMQKPRSWF